MLIIKNLQAGYGQNSVIRGMNFMLGDTEILAVMGRNGMGKSTLMKALMGVVPLAGGSVALNGRELGLLPPHQRVRGGLAYVPQSRMIFPHLTVTENILAGVGADVPEDVWDEIYLLFPVLHEMRERKGGNLSGGQQQQLAIARALVANPKVLLLDEPTEGIQPSIIKELARTLRKIRDMRQIAILVAEQVVSFMMDVCDRALVIERGQFIHETPRAALDAAKVRELIAV
jgi:urea transport system ATP-binding protein